MTGEEIKALAELHTEDLPIEDSQALIFINECILMDLGKDAGVIDSQTVVAAQDTWASLSKTFLSVFEVEKEGSSVPYYGKKYGKSYSGEFDIKDNMLRFPEDGSFTIWGYIIPSAYTSLQEEPEIHAILHYPIALYVASRATFWDDEENPSADTKMREYYMHRTKALAQLSEMRPTTERSRIMRIQPLV